MSRRSHPLTRYTSEAVGAFIIVALVLFALAATQAGRVVEWLNPGVTVRVLMPEEGLYGLSAGAEVEILGTVAGEVREIVIEQDQNMHAQVSIRREAMAFVRRDSEALIKRRFGVAGDAYLEITRGSGPELDEEYAVLEASGRRIPTQTLEQLIADLRERAIPILDQAETAIGALARVATVVEDGQDDIRGFLGALSTVSRRIEAGEGAIGRLFTDARLVEKLEAVLEQGRDAMRALTPILGRMQEVAANAARMSEAIGDQASAIPAVTERARVALGSLNAVLEDVRETTPELPRLARNVAASTQELPALIAQTEAALGELEALMRQLRASWLLGGGGAPETPNRISPLEVTP